MASLKDFAGRYLDILNDFFQFQQSHDHAIDASLFGCDDDDDCDCDGFCPDCEQIIVCEAYKEIESEWDSFYM